MPQLPITKRRLSTKKNGKGVIVLKKSTTRPKTDTVKGPDFASLVEHLRKDYTKLPEKGLYIVPTPIGNAEDITLRALKILDSVDIVACEDTRHTGRLLSRYGINTLRVAYHDHTGPKARSKLIKALVDGASIALVSDSGTPLISDPGYKLILDAIQANVTLTALPGPSAPITALALAGLPPDKFFFAGFLPTSGIARRRALENLATLSVTLLLLESPRRLGRTLSDLLTTLGDRQSAVARELTKMNEQVERGTLLELINRFQKTSGRLRGELVIAVGPPTKTQLESHRINELAEGKEFLRQALTHMNTKSAVQHVAQLTGLSRRLLYRQALEFKKNEE
jgi:16S rRNA (cytidine1402-2'-O)-methyltransferase